MQRLYRYVANARPMRTSDAVKAWCTAWAPRKGSPQALGRCERGDEPGGEDAVARALHGIKIDASDRVESSPPMVGESRCTVLVKVVGVAGVIEFRNAIF